MKKTILKRLVYEETRHAIKVYQNLHYRWLTIGSDIVQTLIHRRQPEIPQLDYIKPLLLPNLLSQGHACLLGLGGGGIAHALIPYLSQYYLMLVEHNPHVIQIAHQYFQLKRLKYTPIYCEDAFYFMKQQKTLFKLIIVDLFNATEFPTACNTFEFFSTCWQRLDSEGVLAVNVIGSRDQRLIFYYLRQLFGYTVVCFPIKNSLNMVFLACKNQIPMAFINSLPKKKLKHLQWGDEWGYLGSFN